MIPLARNLGSLILGASKSNPADDLFLTDSFNPRYSQLMSQSKPATAYFDRDLHRALKRKAAATDRSISQVINEAVRLSLAEDAEDLKAFKNRKSEPNLDFDNVVRSLKRRGKL